MKRSGSGVKEGIRIEREKGGERGRGSDGEWNERRWRGLGGE